MKNYFSGENINLNTNESLFINILHHDDHTHDTYVCATLSDKAFLAERGTKYTCLGKNIRKKVINRPEFWGLNSYNKETDSYRDCYISVNSFIDGERKRDKLASICAIAIDIDAHDGEDINSIIAPLNEAYNNGNLPIPTIINFSGRGYHIYYVFKNSIPSYISTMRRCDIGWCNSISDEKLEKSQKAINYYQNTYRLMLKAYNEILSKTGITVDAKVSDTSRVLRVPNTVNNKVYKQTHDLSKSMCKSVYLSDKYYSLNELNEYSLIKNIKTQEILDVQHEKALKDNKLFDKKNKTKKKNVSFKKNNFATHTHKENFDVRMFSLRRKKVIENIIDLRKDVNGNRNFLLYTYVSADINLNDDYDVLLENALSLNEKFNASLTKTEVISVVNSVYNRTSDDDVKGYKVSNGRIISNLNLSKDEIKLVGLCTENSRENMRKFARDKKLARNEKIISLYKNGYTKRDIENELNKLGYKVSYRTVLTVISVFEKEEIKNKRFDEKMREKMLRVYANLFYKTNENERFLFSNFSFLDKCEKNAYININNSSCEGGSSFFNNIKYLLNKLNFKKNYFKSNTFS